MKKSKVTRVAVERLDLNTGQLGWLPKNPRQWSQQDIDRMRASLAEDPDFPEERPVLAVQGPDGRLVVFAHNLLVHVVKLDGELKTVPCVIHEAQDEADQETIRRRALKDNGGFGSWDTDIIANDWEEFTPAELVDMGLPDYLFGGAAEESQQAGSEEGAKSGTAKEDDFDPDDKDGILVRCKPGDIWQLGDHRLMCGDSTDLETVKALMGGALADMVFTDPPYGVAIGDKNKVLQSVQKAGRIEENIANDTLGVDDLYKVLQKAMENVRLSCKEDASYYVCAPPGGDFGLMMMMMMKDAGLAVRHQIVWNKSAATFSLGRLDYDYKHEAIMYTWTKKHHNYRKGSMRTSVWDVEKPRSCDLHPTMKPLALIENALLDGTKEGDLVLDAFGGSGSTMMAAEQLGRRAYLMELDPHYCDVILARWEKLTGRTAEKLN